MMIKKAEKITDADDLKNAKEQSKAMANFRPRNHRAPARRQPGRREGNQVYYRIVAPCAIDLLERGLSLTQDTSFARKPGEGGALPSVSWSRPCLEMVVNFAIRALRYADL